MKKYYFLIFVFAFSLTNAFGQAPDNEANEVVSKFDKSLQNDTSVKVLIVVEPSRRARETAYFLNDRLIKGRLLVSIDPELIETFNVIEKPIEIDSVKYRRQIYITAKNNYFPKAISLTDLRNKYFPEGPKSKPVIFMIDGKIVHGDYDTYEIDENNLFAITSDNRNEEDKVKLHFIELTTRSEANTNGFEPNNNIWMRGDGIALYK